VSCCAGGNYLEKLEAECGRGARRLPARFKSIQAHYILDAQNADGGFPGRAGRSELYYTSFALRAAALLEIEAASIWASGASFLRGCAQTINDVVDSFCFLHSVGLVEQRGCEVLTAAERRRAVAAVAGILERSRTPEGGFAKTEARAPSVYHTFLADLCYAMLRREMPLREKAVAFVRSRQRADGGFADVSGGRGESGGGVNPTAAAVVFLKGSRALSADSARKAAEFLAAAQDASGGVRAHADAPCPDVMSTFTCLVALRELAAAQLRFAAVARFLRDQAVQGGGFRATRHDSDPDPEYTYYGLGALALLAGRAQAAEAKKCPCARAESG